MQSSKRAKGINVHWPFVYGTQATPLNIKQKDLNASGHTHRWTVFVRGINGEDLSFLFKRVTFKLHETYDEPSRSIDQSPFEVTETGWGEFEISIKLTFSAACNEKPITLFHSLRLHPLDEVSHTTWVKGKTVYSFHYDELVFNEPHESFYQVYCEQNKVEKPQKKTSSMPYSLQAELEEFDKLEIVKNKLYKQIASYQKKISKAKAIKSQGPKVKN